MNQEEKFCKCGCGQIVNSWRGKPREFIKGHNYRLNLSWGSGRPLSDETKQKLSEAHKGIETWNKGKKWKKGVINEGESRIIKPKYKSSKSVTKKPKYNQFVACACGCREPIRAIDKYGHSRTFKKGHHNRQLPPNSGTFGKARKTVEVMAKSQLEKGRGSGNFCLCGCGTEIPKGSHYLRGHLQKNGMPKHECSCGCGVLIQAYFNDGSERRFVLGHQHRNKPSWNKGIKGAMGRPWNKDKELSEKHKTKLSIIKMNSTLKIFYNVPKKVAEGIDFLMWEGSYKELKCACGCGEPVRSRRYYFAIGHRSRLKRVRTTCACGCGTEISAYDERGRPMKFFSNHNSMSWLTTNTSIEIKIEEILNDLKIEFSKNIELIGRTVPDFFIKPKICIYADGDYWHANPNKYKPMDLSDFQWRRKRTDKFINKILRANGYIVLRFWETDINDPKKKAWITEKISDVFEKYGEVRIFNQLDRIV